MQTDPTFGRADGSPRSPKLRRATARFMLSHPLHLVSLGFGSGLSPVMPGTHRTLFAWAAFPPPTRHLTVIEWAALILAAFAPDTSITRSTAQPLATHSPA